MTQNINDEIEVREVSTDVLEQLVAPHINSLFDAKQYFFTPKDYYSDEEKEKIKTLKQNLGQPLRINLVAFHQDKIIGWSWGIQESAEVFYMVNSAVLSEYQGKGIYRSLVMKMIKEVSDKGFQIIYSKHVATNNAVLISKLKAGFTISSFEVSDQYGVLVHLRWYTNPLRQKMMNFRAGGIGPDAQIKKLLNADTAAES